MKIFSSAKLISALVILFFISFTSIFSQRSKKFIYDDLNNKFTLTEIPNKIITLAPNLTEMIFKLGEGGKIVGDTKYCNYPPKAKNISKVGDMLSLDYEKIVQLNPDIIFITVEGNSKQQYEKLKQLGFNVFVSNPRDYSGIKKTFLDISKIFNVEKFAEKEIGNWDNTINKIRSSVKSYTGKTAMFVISVNPLIAAGPNTFINQFLIICGLKNILSHTISNYPIINREEVLKKNPDFIIVTKQDTNFINDALSIFPEWKNLNAIKNHNIIPIDPDLFFRPGPRFAEAARVLYLQIAAKLKAGN